MTTEAMADVDRMSDPHGGPAAGLVGAIARVAASNPKLASALQDAAAAIESRPPTGKPSWPLVLVEGPEKSGKTWLAAEFTASDRLSCSFMLDLGEGSADEYGAIPGTTYQILKHDGTWRSIMTQVRAVHTLGQALLDAGEKPLCLLIDSGTAEWKLHGEWADARARARKKITDPNKEVQITMDLWNDATTRHYQLWNMLMMFPGIVIVTARGGEVAEVVGGQPTGKKTYSVQGHKNMAYDATLWVQLSREHRGMVVGCRSVKYGIRPGKDPAQPIENPDWTLEWLLFEALGLQDMMPEVREIQTLHASAAEQPESKRFSILREQITKARTVEALNIAWRQVPDAVKDGEMSEDEGNALRGIASAQHSYITSQEDAQHRGDGPAPRGDQADAVVNA